MKMSSVSPESGVERSDNGKLQGIDITLPSKGIEYPWTKDGKILIRPWRVSEIKFVVQMTPATYEENLSRVLSQVILKPKGLDPWSLTQGDRSFLFFWLRTQAAAIYNVSLKCSKCGELFSNFEYSLENISVVEITDEYSGSLSVNLPSSKEVVIPRLSTGEDEKFVQEQVVKNNVDSWVATYAQPIISVNGKEMLFEGRYHWVEGLDDGDLACLREFHSWTFHGPDFSSCPFECKKCGGVSKIALPFRAEYYVPTLPFKKLARDAIHNSFVCKRGNTVS